MAQEKISGVVEIENGEKNSPLAGANVFWKGTSQGTTTDKKGKFSLDKIEQTKTLIISYVGFVSDTIEIDNQKEIKVQLKENLELGEFEVVHREKSTTISALNPIKVENLGQKELRKAACCNLSESFETNPTVDASFADAVTGTRQITMLGLSGRYSLLTRELMPNIRTLSNVQGLQFVPGPWVHSIQISKGAGSVIHGYESMSGQINFEIFNPETADKLYVNAYTNTGLRQEINLISSHKISDKAATAILFHANGRFGEFDMNDDNFLDMPTGRQINFMNRWQFYTDNGWEAQAGVHAVYDERESGEMPDFEPSDRPRYDINMVERMVDVFAKAGYNFERPGTSLGFQLNGRLHDNSSKFGLRTYEAEQKSIFYNTIFQSYLFNTNHQYTIGTGGQVDIIDENLSANNFDSNTHVAFGAQDIVNFNRTEFSHGVFAEYSYNIEEKFNLILGLRGDYHNYFGFFATPRIHSRYAFDEKTILRVSAGRGQRTANIFADQYRFFASSRLLNLKTSANNLPYGLNPEVSYNYGVNITRDFTLNYKDGYVSLDFYRTDFRNRVVADWDHQPTELLMYNLEDLSFANSFQAEVFYEPIKRLDVKVAYRFFESKTKYTRGWLQHPLLPQHRAFSNISYETKNEKWMLDLTAIWTGSQRMPYTANNPQEFVKEETTPDYWMFNAQIAYMPTKKLEVYVGFENLTDFRIENPINSADNPFSPYFDTNFAWAPIFGRMIYAGFRLRIPNN